MPEGIKMMPSQSLRIGVDEKMKWIFRTFRDRFLAHQPVGEDAAGLAAARWARDEKDPAHGATIQASSWALRVG